MTTIFMYNKDMKKLMEEFKTFVNRGNVVDMAVGVIVGGAFSTIVSSLVNDVLMPVIAMVTGGNGENFAWLSFELPGGSVLNLGGFIQNIVNFVIIAFTVFMVVKTLNNFKKKEEEKPEVVEEPKPSEELLTLKAIEKELKKLNKK